LLDACRDNPFGKSFRSASRGLAIVSNSPSGTFISYSTSPGQVARDGEGRNSPYTRALLKHMAAPDLPIEHVFKKVRQELHIKTSGQQTPWELSSLSGDFFFNSSDTKHKVQPAAPDKNYQDDDLADEKRKITEEEEKIRREKELLEEKKALAETKRRIEEERRKLEEEKQKLAYVPKVDPAKGTRFIDILNATVTNVRFFEGPDDMPAYGKRSYLTGFSRTRTRFINWELNLQHPAPGRRIDFTIEHIYFDPYGKEINRASQNTYILENWTNSYHQYGYGWKVASSNGWFAGTYRVDLYVNGVKIASESFNVY
jgi:hypothetical protein